MFLANRFKHLHAESVKHEAKLNLSSLHGKFESNMHLSKKGWNYHTYLLCKVMQGNREKLHKVVEEVMGMLGYEEDILAQMCMAHGEDGPDRRLTLQDVWEVHIPTQWYIDQLTGLFNTGKNLFTYSRLK